MNIISFRNRSCLALLLCMRPSAAGVNIVASSSLGEKNGVLDESVLDRIVGVSEEFAILEKVYPAVPPIFKMAGSEVELNVEYLRSWNPPY